MPVRLHVNVDHVATLRQARGTSYPDPVEAARLCEQAGAHGITVHLREDRRHIQDRDVEALRKTVTTVLNLEMAATDAMVAIAERIKPDLVTLVPERREERTTEGGLDVAGQMARMREVKRRLDGAGVRLSLFIDPDDAQLEAAAELGAGSIELHTGDYCESNDERELARLAAAAMGAPMIVAAGHGLTTANVPSLVARIPAVVELNIGHALISDAIFAGLAGSVRAFLAAIEQGERAR